MDILKLWGKTLENGKSYPLVLHKLDTAAVIYEWLKNDEQLFEIITETTCIQGNHELILNYLCFIASLHDIGKATVCFQNKIPEFAKEAGINDPKRESLSFNHGLYGAYWIEKYKNEILDLIKMTESQQQHFIDVLKSTFWHHGKIFLPYEIINNGKQDESEKSIAFNQVRKLRNDLIKTLYDFFKIQDSQIIINTDKVFIFKIFSGLVSVADWIASSDDIIQENYSNDLEAHFNESKSLAVTALKKIGIINDNKEINSIYRFKDLFEFEPRNLQKRTEEVIKNSNKGGLWIIEAPTGEGKTEAALYVYRNIKNRGLYFALPTLATANQMYNRIKKFHSSLNIENPIVLAHGMSWLSESYNQTKSDRKDWTIDSGYDSNGEWFFTRKKTLLANYGVGTVDQIMLSVLKTKHFFVKLFSLAGKTIIIDEVHAYDNFMIFIIKRLLEWCRYLNINVILLSATLPLVMKKELIAGYNNNLQGIENEAFDNSYPLITIVRDEKLEQIILGDTRKKESINISLLKVDKDISKIIEIIKDKLIHGGNILWICNTVKKAQLIAKLLEDYFDKKETDIILFHSRFTNSDRNELENIISKKYGPGSKDRPFRSICVATQVIEQSLDVDFDLIITDIAPIDFLLQRFGRMHRHERNNRPEKFNKPTSIIIIPDKEIKGPEKIRNEWRTPDDLINFAEVYEPFIIYKTMNLLDKIEKINLPEMYRELIEKVYDEKTSTEKEPIIKEDILQKSLSMYMENIRLMETKAGDFVTERPFITYDDMNDNTPIFVEEDNAKGFIAKTRYTDEININLIITKLTNENLLIGNNVFPLNKILEIQIDKKMEEIIVKNSVKTSNKFLIYAIKNEVHIMGMLKQYQEKINKIHSLKNYYIITLDDNNLAYIKDYKLTYNKFLGLQIEKENK